MLLSVASQGVGPTEVSIEVKAGWRDGARLTMTAKVSTMSEPLCPLAPLPLCLLMASLPYVLSPPMYLPPLLPLYPAAVPRLPRSPSLLLPCLPLCCALLCPITPLPSSYIRCASTAPPRPLYRGLLLLLARCLDHLFWRVSPKLAPRSVLSRAHRPHPC